MSSANVKLSVNGVDYLDVLKITVDKSISDFNATSSFTAEFDNYSGDYKNTFNLNDDIIIYADYDTSNPTTKIFRGIIEKIDYNGVGLSESVIISGRDYGAILQDIIVTPRMFKETETSSIISSLMTQNATYKGITLNNLNISSTTIDRITFNNISLFDAISKVSEIAGFYFYIDEDKDFHYEEKDSISSGIEINNTNTLFANFKTSDEDIFNNIYVYGDRQLTGVREIFSSSDVINGSSFVLNDKPHSVVVMGSATNPINIIQPGGVLNLNDPSVDNVKYLVDYNGRTITFTSGGKSGYNTGWIASGVIIDYQRSSLLLSIKSDSNSQLLYGVKDKRIIDKNIKTLDEANIKATSFLNEHKSPTIYGNVKTRGIISLTPGNTVLVNNDFHNINNQTYSVINVKYDFTKDTCLKDSFISIYLNKKIRDFLDLTKEQELRLRALEGSDKETNISEIEFTLGSIIVQSSGGIVIRRIIGSSFYFNVPGHDILNSPSSLLGDMRTGSTVITI